MTNSQMTISIPQPIFEKKEKSVLLRQTPLFFRVFSKIAENLKSGALVFTLPSGEKVGFGDPQSHHWGEISLKDYSAARRTILGGDIGFFESFANGEWDSPDLPAALYVIALNTSEIQPGLHGNKLLTWFDRLRHAYRKNSRAGSKKNISAHYDLGNDFYEKWLDRSMTYSSGLFDGHTNSLELAQENKYRALARKLELEHNQTVLEIGCGWGGFAEFLVKEFDVRVVGLTLSKEQLKYSRERIFKEGLADKIEFRLQDYRDVDGIFDKIASIEMLEAVGKEYWPTYFSKIHECLKPNGIVAFQAITIAEELFEDYASATDFIQRYVFPGGMLPSPNSLRDSVEASGLSWGTAENFGNDYAKTLSIWHAKFIDAWHEIELMGFDNHFNKLWRFYLSYCEAGFRAGTTDVFQVSAKKN